MDIDATSNNGCIQHCEMDCVDFKIIKTDTIDINELEQKHENIMEFDDEKNESNDTDKENELENKEQITEQSTVSNETKIIFKLAIPVCITSISRVVMYNTDQIFLGHLGTKQLAGASMADIVMEILTFFVISPAWSLNALCSQALGSGNNVMAGYWLQICIITCTLLTFPIYVGYFYVGDLVSLFNKDDEVINFCNLFAKLSTLYLWTFAMCAILRTFHESLEVVKPFTFISLFAIIINILCNWLLVHYLAFIGSPLATATSAALQLFLYYIWCVRYKKYYILHDTKPAKKNNWSLTQTILNKKRMKQFAKVVIPNMISDASENWAYQVIILYAATLEAAEIAALSCMFCIWAILWSFYSGIGCATTTRVAKKIGAGNIDEAKLVSKIALVLSMMCCLVISIVIYLFKYFIPAMYSSDHEVQKIMHEAIPYLCVLYVIGGIGWCGGNILESMSKNKYRGIVCVLTAWFGYLPASLYFGFYSDILLNYLNISPVTTIFVVGIFVEFIRTSLLWLLVVNVDWEKASIEAQERNEQYDKLAADDDDDNNYVKLQEKENEENVDCTLQSSLLNDNKAATAV